MLSSTVESRGARRAAFSLALLLALLAPQLFSQSSRAVRAQALLKRVEVARSTAPQEFALRDGDRVLFYGDSITEQRLYTTYVEHYVLTHFPGRRITFINTGWGGDKVTGNDCAACGGVGGLARLRRDVIEHRPTVVTILFGMNDGGYAEFDPARLKVYEDGLTAIIRELKTQTRARLFVMTPTVYDGTRHTPWSHSDRYNEVLDRYSESAKQVAAREGLPVIDLHTATTNALREAKAIDANYAFAADGVHPEADGQLLMAAEILRAWGAEPQGLELNRQLKPDANGSASLTVAAPLPWPVPQPSELLRRVRPEINALGLVRLKLTGLPPGTYQVTIDGASAGDLTAEQLRDGVTLNSISERANADSKALAALVRQRADLFFMRWRQVQVPFSGKYVKSSAAVSGLDSLIDELDQRARLLGALHQYQLVLRRRS